ncbi:MAG: sulfatase-like hydrolase/transferase [Proteobacteria bacterium]|nr:sulfatase-like hydrolase/transferase [Pseudomonadota bacterium]
MYLAILFLTFVFCATWPHTLRQLAATSTIVVAACLLTVFYAIADHFTGEGVTLAVLMHLRYAEQNQLGVARFPWAMAAVAATVLLLAAFFFLCWRLMLKRRLTGIRRPFLGWLVLPLGLVALAANPATRDLWSLREATSVVDDTLTAEMQWRVGAPREKLKSFVYIYLESLERTFLDQNEFPSVAPGLAALEASHLSIHGIQTAPFMNWTVAGMTASQCGVPYEPLKVATPGGAYIPGASCIGNLLANHGYNLSYVGGADLGFGGKGKLYQVHGFSSVIGSDDFDSPSSDRNLWGVNDDVLIRRVKDEFIKLKNHGGPFGLVTLTLTTHPPDGFPSAGCAAQQPFDNPILNAVHCSDRQIVELIEWLQRNAPEDLLIFVGSDHYQVAGAAHDLLNQAPRRENLWFVIGDGAGVIDRPATMVDVAPTFAHLLGFDAHAIGLGRNLLLDEPTMVEKYGYGSFIGMLPGWTLKLWKEINSMSIVMDAKSID